MNSKPSPKKDWFYPYNFVRINGEKVERQAIEKGDLSGKIKCILKNKSPLFFPDKNNLENFYEENDKYLIPASSLKGTFRKVLEAISNSCMPNIGDKKFEQRSTFNSKTKIKFGIIKKFPTKNILGEIVEAEVKIIKKLTKNEKKEEIRNIKLSELKKKYDSNIIEKIIKEEINLNSDTEVVEWIRTINLKKEKVVQILYPKSNGKTYQFTLDEYNDLQYVVDARKKRDKNYYINLKEKSQYPIIFQVEEEKAVKLAFTQNPRLKNKYSPLDLLPESLHACKTIENACYGCRVFGMTGNKDEEIAQDDKDKITYQGRVFFKDATIDKSKANIQTNPVLIKSLGEPHPTLTSFYLENGTYDNDKARIRGRKFYWHHKDKIDTDFSKFKASITPEKEEKHNSSIQFMNHGNEFEFEVSFKNLKEDELGLLLLTLELEEGMLHKFGKAKALGFGSSEVKIKELLLESKDRYNSLDASFEISSDKQMYIDNFKNMFNLEATDQWNDLKVIMNKENKLDFSKSPFPEEQKFNNKTNSMSGEFNTLNWFTKMKKDLKDNFRLPEIQKYK